MPFDEPWWWYGPDRRASPPTLLRPVAALWGSVAIARWRRSTPYRSRLPVICIGNFTAGGTGKTPLTTLVASEVKALGLTPVVLTRGYGGRRRGPHWVDAARDTARDVGDEPLLHAARTAVVVARDRAAGARAIEARADGGHVIVMDDGLQNPSLAKDLTIALMDGKRGIGNGGVIPAGPLRAPLAFQLGLTNAVVLTMQGIDAPQATRQRLLADYDGPILSATVEPDGDAAWLKGRTVVAWAGIGAPHRFFDLLRRLGADVRSEVVFRDHHELSHAEASGIIESARETSAALVTTEKDWTRLAGSDGARAMLRTESRYLPIAMKIAGSDLARLRALITAAVNSSSVRQ